jgi:hypothetical protein
MVAVAESRLWARVRPVLLLGAATADGDESFGGVSDPVPGLSVPVPVATSVSLRWDETDPERQLGSRWTERPTP